MSSAAASDMCEACDGSGLVHYTEIREAHAYRDGKAEVAFAAACMCAAGVRRARPLGAFPRIDTVFPLPVVERQFFPAHGIPRSALIEISDTELTAVGIPPKMRRWTLDTYPNQRATQLDAAKEWLTTAPQRDLVLMGPQGTGKTGLAVGLLRAVHASGRSVRFLQVNEWLLRLQAGFNTARGEGPSELELLLPATAPYLLVLDDLNARRPDKQSGQMSDYFADVLQLVINKRQGADRPTILTTNLKAEELQDYLTPTLYDRLREGEFWNFDGESQRGPKPVLPFPSRARKSARKKR